MDKPLYERHGSLGHEQHDHGRQTNMKFALVLGGSKKSRRIIDVVIDLNHRCSNGQNLFLSQRDPDLAEEGAVKGFQRAGCSPPSLLVVWMEVGRRGGEKMRGEGGRGRGRCTLYTNERERQPDQQPSDLPWT